MPSTDRTVVVMYIVIRLFSSVRFWTGSSRKLGRKQGSHPNQVVAGESQQGRKFNFPSASHLRSPQQANVLAPTESFFDQFPCLDAQRIPGVAGRALVNRGSAVAFNVLSNMRCHIEGANIFDKLVYVRPYRPRQYSVSRQILL